MRKCEAHDIPQDAEFPQVWDWIKDAHYMKVVDHRTNKTYDAWVSHVSLPLSVSILMKKLSTCRWKTDP